MSSKRIKHLKPIWIITILFLVLNSNFGRACVNDTLVENRTLCESFTWRNGVTYTSSQTDVSFIVNGVASGGCDSVYLLNLFIAPTPLEISIVVDSTVSCNGFSDGGMTATATGGVEPYSYFWIPEFSPALPDPTSPSISGIVGTYNCTVTDAFGCVVDAIETVIEPPPLSAFAGTLSHITCHGYSDGSLYIYGSGGTPYSIENGYLFTWNNGATTAYVNNASEGFHYATIIDANGCISLSDTTYITEPAVLMAYTLNTPVSCHGFSDGKLDIQVSGGMNPYSYSWSPLIGSLDGGSQYNIPVGTYTCTITDFNGCVIEVTDSVVVGPTELSVDIDAYDITCFGEIDGSVSVIVSGGYGNYSYQWDDVNSSTEHTISNLSAGTYSLTVLDDFSNEEYNYITCSLVVEVTILEPSLLTSAIESFENVACLGEATGSATVAVTGGTGDYSYSWSPYGGTNDTADSLSNGNYTILVTDANNCTTSSSVTIEDPLVAFTASLNGQTDVTCYGYSTGSATVDADGLQPITYQWLPEGGSNNTASDLPAGNYVVEVTDGYGCTKILQTEITESEPNTRYDAIVICDSYTWIDGNTYTSSSDSIAYVIMGVAADGCDSIIVLNLTVNSLPDIMTTIAGTTLTANESDGTYQWIDCNNNNSPIAGATNQSFEATMNGSYAVIVDNGNCVDTSVCTIINNVGFGIIDDSVFYTVYPNPTTEKVVILTPNVDNFIVEIQNNIGETIEVVELSGKQNEVFIRSDAGVYFLKITSNNLLHVAKVVKQ